MLKNEQLFYESPQAKTIEINVEQICKGSKTVNDPFGNLDPTEEEW